MTSIDYEPLDWRNWETRFLRFLETPDPRKRVISLQLTPYPLGKAPDFWALSYTWGNDDDMRLASIDGRHCYIRKNLANAFLHCGLEAGDYMWADALCINQNDVPEKNYQLSFMGQIYAQASRTLVWLGESEVYTELAHGYLRNCEEAAISSDAEWSTSVGRQRLDRETSSSFGGAYEFPSGTFERCYANRSFIFEEAMRDMEQVENAKEGVRELLTRPYWERIWIIQEIAKSPHVVVKCGHHHFDLEILLLASLAISDMLHRARCLLGAIRKFRVQTQPTRSVGSRVSLLEALVLTRYSLSKDPRDKIYALLGLTSDGNDLLPRPSYADSETDVLCRLSMNILNSRRASNFITIARHNFDRRHTSSAPWIMRLAALQSLPPWLEKLSAVDHTGQTWNFDAQTGILRTHAVQMARISTLSGTRSARRANRYGIDPPDGQTLLYLSILLQRFSRNIIMTTDLAAGDQLTDAFARMIRDADKGYTDYAAQYELDPFRSTLKDIGAMELDGESINTWAYNYISKRYREDLDLRGRSIRSSPGRRLPIQIPTSAFKDIQQALNGLLCSAGFRLKLAMTDLDEPVLVRAKHKASGKIFQVDQSHLPLILDYDSDSGHYLVIGEVCFGKHADGSWWSAQGTLRTLRPASANDSERISIQLDPTERW